MSVVLQLSLRVGYGAVFAVAALACLGSVTRGLTVEDRATRYGLVAVLVTAGLWAVTHLGVLYAPTQSLKTAWYTAGLVVGLGTVFAWLYFCSAYTDRTYHRERPYRYAGLGLYTGIVAIKLTNPLHGQYFTAEMVASPFPHLAIQHGPIHWIATGLAYMLAAIGIFMLYEAFVESGYETRSLAALVGLTGLPVALDLLAYESTALIDIIYAPLGVAVFAVGVLFVTRDRFLAVQVTGSIPEPVLFLDDDDRIKEYNHAAGDLFTGLGSTGGHVTAALPLDSVPAGQEILELDREGARYYLVNESSFSTAQSAISRMLVFVDVTELERRRRELERHNDHLEDLSAGIRHELLNSLQVVDGQVSAAGSALDAGDVAQARQTLQTVSRQTGEMVTIVDGLTTLTQYGQSVDGLEPVALDEVVEHAWNEVESSRLVVHAETDTVVEADRIRLHELFVGLLDFLAHNDATEVRVERRSDGFCVVTDWTPSMEAESELFEYEGALPDTNTGLVLPKVRTLAGVQGWTVDLNHTESAARLVVADAVVHETGEASAANAEETTTADHSHPG